jgi:hypothetical protein
VDISVIALYLIAYSPQEDPIVPPDVRDELGQGGQARDMSADRRGTDRCRHAASLDQLTTWPR